MPATKFESYAKLLHNQSPLRSVRITSVLLQPQYAAALTVDPLLPLYIEALIRCDLIIIPDVLRVLIQHTRLRPSDSSNDHTPRTGGKTLPRKYNAPQLEESILFKISRFQATGQRPKGPREALQTLKAAAEWMSMAVTGSGSSVMLSDVDGGPNHPSPEVLALREAVGMLAVSLVENPRVLDLLNGMCPKGSSSFRLAYFYLDSHVFAVLCHFTCTSSFSASLHVFGQFSCLAHPMICGSLLSAYQMSSRPSQKPSLH